MTSEAAAFDRAMDASKEFVAAANRLPEPSRKFSLNDGTLAILEILAELDEGQGDESELGARLAETEVRLAEKIESCAYVVNDLARLAASRKEEGKRLTDQARTLEKAVERLKGMMLTAMGAMRQDKLMLPRLTVAIRQNPPAVKFADEPPTISVDGYEYPPAHVPLKYLTIVTVYKVDKRKILSDLRDTGEVIPGVSAERATRLEISR